MTRPAAVALTASLLVHLLVFTAVSVLPPSRPDVSPADTESIIKMVLVQQGALETADPVESVPQAEPPKELPAPTHSTNLPRVAEAQSAPVVGTTPRLETTPNSVQQTLAPAPTLDLRRPDAWPLLATQSPEELANLTFKKSTRDAIAQRQQERARSRALSRAQVERLGLPEEAYRRRTDAGEEVKTAKGCFVKRAENGPNGHSERWWRTACRDSSKPQWQLELLTFGPDHRALQNPAETRPQP